MIPIKVSTSHFYDFDVCVPTIARGLDSTPILWLRKSFASAIYSRFNAVSPAPPIKVRFWRFFTDVFVVAFLMECDADGLLMIEQVLSHPCNHPVVKRHYTHTTSLILFLFEHWVTWSFLWLRMLQCYAAPTHININQMTPKTRALPSITHQVESFGKAAPMTSHFQDNCATHLDLLPLDTTWNDF